MFLRLLVLSLVLILPLQATELSEKVYLTQEEALNAIFPTATQIQTLQVTLSEDDKQQIETAMGTDLDSTQYTVFQGYKDDTFLGSAYELDQLGKYYPITMMIHILPNVSVGDVRVMVYRERIGADVRKNRFLKQFRKKTLRSPLMVDQDIDGISGATISSWSVATAVKKALYLTQYVQDEKMASR